VDSGTRDSGTEPLTLAQDCRKKDAGQALEMLEKVQWSPVVRTVSTIEMAKMPEAVEKNAP
jgi:hypothetical protein